MTREHEGVVRGQVSTEHVVQLFDDSESLAETVGSFLAEGWQAGDTLLVAARPEHWTLTARRLARDCPVEQAIATGRLVVLDAATTLATFVRNDHPVPERFAAVVGGMVEKLSAASGKRLRIYGEMVDILASQGEFASAVELEHLWNDLGCSYSFTLLCGYSSGSFGDPRTAGLLRDICQAHTEAKAKPSDLLGSWLLADRQPHFHSAAPDAL